VVERPPLDREVRGSNPSHDTMAFLLGRHYEFPQSGIIKGKLLIIIIMNVLYLSIFKVWTFKLLNGKITDRLDFFFNFGT
jgi:hypothetical protein